MNIHTLAANAGRLTVRIHEPFTVCQVDEENQADWVRIHPTLKRVPGGRLILSVSRDRDIYDEEMLMYASDDGGHSWQEFLNWPTASQRGRHLSTACATLGDGSCVVVAASTGLFATQEPGVYRMPSWRSKDGGTTWGEMEPARVEMPVGEAFDIYDPPSPHRKFFQQWCKVQAPPALQALFEPLGRRRLLSFAALFPLDGSRLLGFFYHSPQWGEPYIVVSNF
ncbi:MAG TPA: sialidase family protein [Abditibacteriaceae bacterium]|nr:sialidase family protein [Abditibacteriaceae bacterium]